MHLHDVENQQFPRDAQETFFDQTHPNEALVHPSKAPGSVRML